MLAIRGELQETLFRRIFNICPAPYKADLIEAACIILLVRQTWAEPFLTGVEQSPIARVVITHVSMAISEPSAKPGVLTETRDDTQGGSMK